MIQQWRADWHYSGASRTSRGSSPQPQYGLVSLQASHLLHTLNWIPLCVRRKKQKAIVCRRILLGQSVTPSSHLTPNPRPNPRTNHSIPLLNSVCQNNIIPIFLFCQLCPHLEPSARISHLCTFISLIQSQTQNLSHFVNAYLHSPVSSSCLCFLHLCFFVGYLTCPNCILSIQGGLYASIQLLFGLFPLYTFLH